MMDAKRLRPHGRSGKGTQAVAPNQRPLPVLPHYAQPLTGSLAHGGFVILLLLQTPAKLAASCWAL